MFYQGIVDWLEKGWCRRLLLQLECGSKNINFYIQNNSVYDYGDVVEISGSLVSYLNPHGYVTGSNRSDEFNFTSTKVNTYLYESDFHVNIKSNNYASADDTFFFTIYFFDGVKWVHKVITLTFRSIGITIISPINKMSIHLTSTNSLKIVGTFFSLSNTSKISIIYGPFWYIHDFEDNDSYWHHINKSTENGWYYYTNNSFFTNGLNLIRIRISNGIAIDEDTKEVYFEGLPESSSQPSTLPINNSTPTNPDSSPNPRPPELRSNDIIFFSLIFGTLGLISYKGVKSFTRARSLENIQRDISSAPERKIQAISEIREKVDTKIQLLDRKKSKPEFIPKRRGKR